MKWKIKRFKYKYDGGKHMVFVSGSIWKGNSDQMMQK